MATLCTWGIKPEGMTMEEWRRRCGIEPEGSPYDITSPTDSVIGADFQGLSAEEQERQREEWKAELRKTEEEILTLRQVLTAKERHAAGLKRRLGITQWREFSEDMTQVMMMMMMITR